jgi:hypothetical protein
MSIVVDYAALGLDTDYAAPSVAPSISSMVTKEVRDAIYDTPEVQAIVEATVKAYLASLTLEVTYMGEKRFFNDAVEVANFYGELNETRRKLYRVIKNGTAEQVINARAFEAEIDSLKDEVKKWARDHKVNTQTGNAQTSEGVGFVALRKVDLYS